ncbi:MAG: tetratricopeptide repeat protein [Neisseria meningitidis]|nr:tetratricopeptide repeat protein [Neisseria meningitidis]
MKTLSHSLFLLPLTLLATSCAVSHPPQPADNPNFVLPDIPREPLHAKSIPYPRLDAQTQIDHLGIQIARLERTVEELNQRLHTLEQQRNIKRPTTSASQPKAQRLDDRKLKMNYLANGGGVPSETDSAAQNELRLYNQAQKYYQRNNFSAAVAILKEADGGNGSEIARRNMYLLLQSQQHLGNCESVIEIGNRYANRFRNSPQAPDAMYSIGQCQYKLQQKDIARSTWRKLIQSFPNSEAAKRASISLKQR